MKAATSGLIALLATGVFDMADLYTITLNGGTVLRWTGADRPITFGGHTWVVGPTIERGVISNKIGTETSTFQMTLGQPADVSVTINGVGLIPFIASQGLDGATVLLERAYLPTWADPVTGTMIDFSGRVTSVKGIGLLTASVTVSSWFVILNTNAPPDLVQPSCLNSLFDSHCTLAASAFKVSKAVSGAGMTQLAFQTTATNADGYFNQGRIVFTSGANAGLSRAVKSYVNSSGAMVLSYPLPVAPSAGDTFDAYPGCDLTQATCLAKFANLSHFRGAPYVPVPEAAVS